MTVPRVFTIPAGESFLDALARGLWDDAGGSPETLARMTVLLPTRRACRALVEAFLRVGDGRPMLLPALRPIGDVDEDIDPPDETLDLPPAIGIATRELLLARMIAARKDIDVDEAAAIALARSLAAFLDGAILEEVPLDALDTLVPDAFAGHWQKTLDLLRLVREAWPAILAERGEIDPSAHRVRRIRALAERWEREPPRAPVYAAGSTGSIPATARLLATIAGLEHGAVVLPGIDLELDEASWGLVADEPGHPQHGLHRLLGVMGITRPEVRVWPAVRKDDPARARRRLLGDALLPATSTTRWNAARHDDKAFTGLERVTASHEQEEAMAVALLLRETLASPGRTTALVTPDRALARRVAVELERWGVQIDDSAGMALAVTPAASFLRLIARAIRTELAPVELLACLKHPFCVAGRARAAHLRLTRRLDRRALRGPRPAPGFDGLRAAVGEDASLRSFVDDLDRRIAPMMALTGRAALADMLAAQLAVAESLSATPEGGPSPLWEGEAGEALAQFVADLADDAGMTTTLVSWPSLLDALLAGRVVRRRYGQHPRLAIWGPLEARLQHADRIILAGLNEGTWPAIVREDPWLSRPMRKDMGLPPLERALGLAAHDFVQAASAADVVLSRAMRVGGTPGVPSRWLLRLDAMLAGDARWQACARGSLAAWVEGLDDPGVPPEACEPPRPCPPIAARPRQLSVTRIETWIRDPYAIHARYILRLKPLDPIDADPGAAERGQAIHQALDRFVKEHGREMPDDAMEALERLGEEAFGRWLERPSIRAFWWPRFRRVAAWFIDFETRRRASGLLPIASEVQGAMTIDGPAGAFTLTATADRLDRDATGAIHLLDYKTGQAPSWKQIAAGLAPQLPLEGAILRAGGFSGVAGPLGAIGLVRLSSGDPAGKLESFEDHDPNQTAEAALEGLRRRVRDFDDPATPYLSRPVAQWITRAGDYDHLARVAEWASALGDES